MSFDLLQPMLGEKLLLRPLVPDDWCALFSVAQDKAIWAMHPMHDRWQEPVFRAFFDDALANVPPAGASFAIIDQASDDMIGSTRFGGYDQHAREIEIGWSFLATRYWRTGHNSEMKALMMRRAFTLVDRIYYTIGADNMRSRAAVERLGAALVGPYVHPNPLMTAPHVRYAITEAQARAAGSI